MIKMFVRHQVADFKKWKIVFDEHDSFRRKAGCIKSEVFTNSQNPNEVLSVLRWESKEHAQKFSQDPGLKEAMAEGGVVGIPEFSFAE
jgi:quinol monooxygenase YgiN